MKHLYKTNASPHHIIYYLITLRKWRGKTIFSSIEISIDAIFHYSKSKKMIIVVILIFIATVVATLAITLPIVLKDGDEKANSTDSNSTSTTLSSTSIRPSSITGTCVVYTNIDD